VAQDGIAAEIDTVGRTTRSMRRRRWALIVTGSSRSPRSRGRSRTASGSSARQPAQPALPAIRQSILDLAAAGKLTVPIGQTFPLDQAPAAVATLAGRHAHGKLALVVG
jgi:NADPH:quinone reductase-like Zn-dependent oxidoreductase